MKKSLTIICTLFLVATLTACNLWHNITGHPDRYFTPGAIKILETYNKLLMRKDTCSTGQHGLIYAVNATMPAIDYNVPDKTDSLVTFAAGISVNEPYQIRNIWECYNIGYTYYGFCPPNPYHFPYPHDAYHTNASYLTKFVIVSEFQSLKPQDATTSNPAIHWIDLTKVAALDVAHITLEDRNGFISTNYPDLYKDKTVELGIVCTLRFKNGDVKECYIVGNYQNTVHWKK